MGVADNASCMPISLMLKSPYRRIENGGAGGPCKGALCADGEAEPVPVEDHVKGENAAEPSVEGAGTGCFLEGEPCPVERGSPVGAVLQGPVGAKDRAIRAGVGGEQSADLPGHLVKP